MDPQLRHYWCDYVAYIQVVYILRFIVRVCFILNSFIFVFAQLGSELSSLASKLLIWQVLQLADNGRF